MFSHRSSTNEENRTCEKSRNVIRANASSHVVLKRQRCVRHPSFAQCQTSLPALLWRHKANWLAWQHQCSRTAQTWRLGDHYACSMPRRVWDETSRKVNRRTFFQFGQPRPQDMQVGAVALSSSFAAPPSPLRHHQDDAYVPHHLEVKARDIPTAPVIAGPRTVRGKMNVRVEPVTIVMLTLLHVDTDTSHVAMSPTLSSPPCGRPLHPAGPCSIIESSQHGGAALPPVLCRGVIRNGQQEGHHEVRRVPRGR